MSGSRLTEADRRAIWNLHSRGLNTNEIALELGRAYSSIATLIKGAGGIRPHEPHRSPSRLSFAEREEISRGISAKEAFAAIAQRIGRSTSTVSREVSVNGGRRRYRAHRADRAATVRARRPKLSKLAGSWRLRLEVGSRLDQLWSPQQISASLRLAFPGDPTMWLSHESIYQALFVREHAVFAPDAHRLLRTGRPRRRARRSLRAERRGKNPHMVMISQRPVDADDRKVAGHWEGDLIMGRGHRRAIGTLVERTSRFVLLLNLVDGYSADQLNAALKVQLARLPKGLRRSLTWDQGTEMSGHIELTASTGLPVYFCQPRSPWQRGTNENTNGLLRQYFPKGADLADVTQHRLDAVAQQLNARPRRALSWASPAEQFASLCALTG
jgi:IS30 family transposase